MIVAMSMAVEFGRLWVSVSANPSKLGEVPNA